MKKNRICFAFVAALFAASVFSCSSSSKDCTAEISAGGKTFAATGKSIEEARRNACNKYCLETDPKCEAMYGIWLDSPAGRAAGSPHKMRALSEDKQLLDCVTITCADACLADVGSGKLVCKSGCGDK